jgi:hypothetical protein
MTKKDKIKKQFLKDPKVLSFQQILSFLESEWYKLVEAKWSHCKIEHVLTWEIEVIAIHNNQIKDIYKVLLKRFYLKH